jgi:hypothetical protein
MSRHAVNGKVGQQCGASSIAPNVDEKFRVRSSINSLLSYCRGICDVSDESHLILDPLRSNHRGPQKLQNGHNVDAVNRVFIELNTVSATPPIKIAAS